MSTHTKVEQLWEQFRDAIDQAHKANNGNISGVLRDYARDIGWHDNTEKLLQVETANERQHRRGQSSPKGFSARDASMLLLLAQVVSGAQGEAIPLATEFLTFRKTAVEARVLGWLVREHLTSEWIGQVESLDYAKLMNPGGA